MEEFAPNRSCPKCAYEKVRVWYCEKEQPALICWCALDEMDDDEHFHRTCERCFYEWLEKTLQSDAA